MIENLDCQIYQVNDSNYDNKCRHNNNDNNNNNNNNNINYSIKHYIENI